MSFRVEKVTWSKEQRGGTHVDRYPDTCPLCLHGIEPSKLLMYCAEERAGQDNCLQIVCRCPRKDCQQFFIANYSSNRGDWNNFVFRHAQPYVCKMENFSNTIHKISSSFCEIYNQAYAAEQHKLLEICGTGYRKSLEFLIKDYLLKQKPKETEKIKNKFLGDCIEKYIKNPQIKIVAKRAVWLGNDETHYMRKWEDKDLADLKGLIHLTVHWLEMMHLLPGSLITLHPIELHSVQKPH